MIKINFNDKTTYAFEREVLEGKIIEAAKQKVEETADFNPMLTTTIKSTIGMVLGMIGNPKPKEFTGSNMDYALSLVITGALDELEKETIHIKAEEVEGN